MLELLIDVEGNKKNIMLVQNGNLIERYIEEQGQDRLEGDIYLGIVKNILPGMQAAFVDIGKEKNTFIHIRDIIPKVSDETGNKNENFANYNIKNYLKIDEPIMVQVKKDSTNKKGARISSHLSIPGRFVVIMPGEKFVTLSQKIGDENERVRLKEIVNKNIPEGYGAIIRTSAIAKSETEIIKDLTKTIEKYVSIEKAFREAIENKNEIKPQLLCKSEDVVQRMLTDLMDQNLERILTNDVTVYESIKEKLQSTNKEHTGKSSTETENEGTEKKKIKLELKENIADMYNLRKQLEELENRKIWLKCGGFITIDKTEALTAIDVNSGKYTGKKDLEQTIFTVNKEATIEIAKQLRLRDIGGIIIIDYIDMSNKENENKIIELFKEQLKKDRSKTQIVGFSKLNLLEMTRKHMCSKD